jgi:hypothetical protein
MQKAETIAHLFTIWLTEYLSPLFRPTDQTKKTPFKILLLIDNAACHARALLEMCNEVHTVFMPANNVYPAAHGSRRN